MEMKKRKFTEPDDKRLCEISSEVYKTKSYHLYFDENWEHYTEWWDLVDRMGNKNNMIQSLNNLNSI